MSKTGQGGKTNALDRLAGPGRPRGRQEVYLVQLRLPISLAKRLDDYLATLPMHPSRQQAIRWVLEQHLNDVAKEG
jgi:hypothetical protein